MLSSMDHNYDISFQYKYMCVITNVIRTFDKIQMTLLRHAYILDTLG